MSGKNVRLIVQQTHMLTVGTRMYHTLESACHAVVWFFLNLHKYMLERHGYG